MKLTTKIRFFVAVCASAVLATLHAQAHEAKVLKVTGAAEVQLAANGSAQPLVVGMLIPEGATIKTASGAQVYLEAAPGVVATIESETTVVVEKLLIQKQGDTVISQEALLDLKKGSIISTIDPAKKSINTYGVRTPKGVAAARGTVFGASVTFTATGESNTTVATLNGFVTLDLGGGVSVDVPFGQAASGGSEQAGATTQALEAAIAASGQTGLTVAALLQEAVDAVAGNVAANTSAAGGSDTATAVLAAVVSAASAAQPDRASAFVATAVAAAVTTGSATGGTSNAAVAAIVEASVRAAPAQAATISQSAASTVVQVKVTEAAAAVRAAGGDAAAVAAAVAEATTSSEATLVTIAQTAVNTAASTGSTITAAAITASVNTGAQQGADTAQTVANVPVTTPPPVQATPAATAPSEVITPPVVTPILPPVSPSA